jgi:hypothetical protein
MESGSSRPAHSLAKEGGWLGIGGTHTNLIQKGTPKRNTTSKPKKLKAGGTSLVVVAKAVALMADNLSNLSDLADEDITLGLGISGGTIRKRESFEGSKERPRSRIRSTKRSLRRLNHVFPQVEGLASLSSLCVRGVGHINITSLLKGGHVQGRRQSKRGWLKIKL